MKNITKSVDIRYTVCYNNNMKGGIKVAKKKHKKKHQLEKAAIIVSIINGVAATICIIYETFFK